MNHQPSSPGGGRTRRSTATSHHRRNLARTMAAVGIGLAALVAATPAHAADLQATPSTLSSVFASAKAGDTINLASGTYSSFKGGQKSGVVTLKPQSGATATISSTTLTDNQNVTFDGLKFGGLQLTGTNTKNITVRNSDFTGAQLTLQTGTLQNANIDIANNRFVNTDPCSGCGKGRVYLPNNTSSPSGITIENNYFAGGASDGILNGSNGTRILNNEFTNLVQGDPTINHTDSIQLYGSKNTVVRGNYFHGVEDCIMAPDGVDHETIDGNVCVVSGTQYGFTFGSDNSSVITHNTVPNRGIRACQQKSGAPAPHGTVLRDNISSTISCESSGGIASSDYNLVADGSQKGAHGMTGKPTYVGGASPATMPGFALTSTSMGDGKASDGTDIGAVQSGSATPPASPTPTPTPSPTPTPTPPPATTTAAFSFSPTSPLAGQVVHFDGSAATCAATPCTYSWADDGSDGAGGTQWPLGTGQKLDFTFKGAGTKHVRLTVKDAQSHTATVEHDVVVK